MGGCQTEAALTLLVGEEVVKVMRFRFAPREADQGEIYTRNI